MTRTRVTRMFAMVAVALLALPARAALSDPLPMSITVPVPLDGDVRLCVLHASSQCIASKIVKGTALVVDLEYHGAQPTVTVNGCSFGETGVSVLLTGVPDGSRLKASLRHPSLRPQHIETTIVSGDEKNLVENYERGVCVLVDA